MIRSLFGRNPRPVRAGVSADAWLQDADAASVPRIDEVSGHARPGSIGISYAEPEFHALADEQEVSWPAEGEREARPYQLEAQGLVPEADAVAFLLAESETNVRQANADHQHAVRTLTPYTQREPGARWRYWLCWPVLWFGSWTGSLHHPHRNRVRRRGCGGLKRACRFRVGARGRQLRPRRAG